MCKCFLRQMYLVIHVMKIRESHEKGREKSNLKQKKREKQLCHKRSSWYSKTQRSKMCYLCRWLWRLVRQSYHGLNFSSQIVDNQRKPFIRLTVDHKTHIFGYYRRFGFMYSRSWFIVRDEVASEDGFECKTRNIARRAHLHLFAPCFLSFNYCTVDNHALSHVPWTWRIITVIPLEENEKKRSLFLSWRDVIVTRID